MSTGKGCDCHASITAQLTERFKSMAPSATDHKVELQGYGFAIIDNKMVLRPYMPYKAGAEFPLKKGGTKWKTQTGNMVFRYCPFCAKELA
jgi:hypothetical protein